MMTLSLSCKSRSVLLECNNSYRQIEKRCPREYTRFDCDCVQPMERAERTVTTHHLIDMAKASHKTDVLLNRLYVFLLRMELVG